MTVLATLAVGCPKCGERRRVDPVGRRWPNGALLDVVLAAQCKPCELVWIVGPLMKLIT